MVKFYDWVVKLMIIDSKPIISSYDLTELQKIYLTFINTSNSSSSPSSLYSYFPNRLISAAHILIVAKDDYCEFGSIMNLEY